MDPLITHYAAREVAVLVGSVRRASLDWGQAARVAVDAAAPLLTRAMDCEDRARALLDMIAWPTLGLAVVPYAASPEV